MVTRAGRKDGFPSSACFTIHQSRHRNVDGIVDIGGALWKRSRCRCLEAERANSEVGPIGNQFVRVWTHAFPADIRICSKSPESFITMRSVQWLASWTHFICFVVLKAAGPVPTNKSITSEAASAEPLPSQWRKRSDMQLFICSASHNLIISSSLALAPAVATCVGWRWRRCNPDQ